MLIIGFVLHRAFTDSVLYSYLDLYLSTDPASPYYFGDKSLVVHSTNTTRLTCANFMSAASVTSASPTASATHAVYTGAADQLALGGGLLGGALLAALFIL